MVVDEKRQYVIDGQNFRSLDEFYDEISSVLIPETFWGKNLDAFNDILRGGFGTPEEGFILRWINSDISRARMTSDFDDLVDIINVHCPGGQEEEDGVELVLS